jgi:hypothetical protein
MLSGSSKGTGALRALHYIRGHEIAMNLLRTTPCSTLLTMTREIPPQINYQNAVRIKQYTKRTARDGRGTK